MSTLNKNIIRGGLISSYLLLIALSIFGISALYSYLNTGADRGTMLHTKIKTTVHYTPQITWETTSNMGRPIDEQTLKTIENDYLEAWYVRHVAYKTNLKNGINDFYTANARETIFNTIKLNVEENISIESTTLEHHPTLAFFSEDGQLAILKDENVVEYKRIYKDNQFVLETTETANYKVILLLEDGFWRIRHLVKEPAKNVSEYQSKKGISSLEFKGINYYPQATPWNLFGPNFNLDTIDKDFKIINQAKLNTVRLFIPYGSFGKASVFPGKIKKLKQVLDAAEANHLKVVATLFDFYGDYSVLDWTLTQKHATTVVSTFKDHPAILAWDIKNEPNLDFESRGELLVTSWLKQMINHVKTIDQNHAVTIGWSNAKSAPILKNKVDFVSFHYYEAIDDLESVLKTLKTEIPNKPIALTEFGFSSYNGIWNPFGASEKNQASYFKKAQHLLKQNKLPFMSWTLYDFERVPKKVVGRLPWRKNAQKEYGFINSSGEKKPAFEYISW